MDLSSKDLIARCTRDALRSRAATRAFVDGEVDVESPWFPEYQGRELDFAADVLRLRHHRTKRIKLWRFQMYAFEALFKHRLVAIYGARGIGKDFVSGYLAPTFFYTAPSRILTTAPGLRQVKYVLWSEIRRAVSGASVPLRGDHGSMSIHLDERHYAIGIPSKDPNAVRGWHADPKIGGDPDADFLSPEDIADFEKDDTAGTRLLVIIDEPQGLSQEVFDILRGMFNKPNVYCLMIGNPMLGLEDDHEYVHTLTKDIGFHRIKVSAFRESEFPDPNSHLYDKVFDRVPETLISKDSLEKARRRHDPKDPVFMSDYLGQFSEGSVDQKVITRAILGSAMASLATLDRRELGPRIGIDIGTGNPDPCTASLAMNGVKLASDEWRPAKGDKQARVSTAEWCGKLMVDWGKAIGKRYPDQWDGSPITGNRVSIDDTSNPGVCDILYGKGVPTDRVNFARAPEGHWPELRGNMRYLNVRAEMHWNARCGLQEGIFAIDPEQFPKSAEEACWAKYIRKTDGMGTIIQIEAKDDIKKRHKRSPDHWDADILAFRETKPESIVRTAGIPHRGTVGKSAARAASARVGWTRRS